LHIRTFGARDLNGDGKIDPAAGENGTFLSSIPRLDELAALGVNTIHLLPIHPPGQMTKLGVAGSAYAPESYHKLNPEYDVPNNGLSVIDEARIFVNEAHKRGIHIMVDVPSCASVDLAHSRPDLIATDSKGNPLTPTNWIDILMMKNDQKLVDYFQGFFDLMVNQVGVDGFRVDVARARPDEFWKHFIGKYPNMGWLGETYTEEDASPMANIPRDRPEALLRAGFQTMYGQFHIFHQWPNAKTYMDYLLDINEMFERAGGRKSAIGSFLTHDDPSMMGRGGALIYLLSSGLMATQPWTNPYILDGFPTGYKHEFDIFNFVPPHIGDNPEIGAFLKEALAVRKMNPDILTTGSFIPVPVTNDPESQVIAFARHANGRTMLVIANKDVNARSVGTLNIPGLRADQPLNNLVPAYGQPSRFKVEPEKISVELGPGRFHLFEIDTPDIQSRLRSYPGIPQARTV
jgi:glycosidase